MTRLIAFLLLSMIVLQLPARADELRPGYLELTQQDETRWGLVWKAPMKGGVTPATQPILPANCKMESEMTRELASLAVISRGAIRCQGKIDGQQIGLSDFASAQNDVLVRVAPLGKEALALRLTADRPIVTVPGADEEAGLSGNVAWTYFVIGIEHIIFGLDHLLFVLCLVLLIRGGWTIAKTVTAFTLAHSITLVGVTLGWFGLPQQPVEVVIALSIIFLAVEIVKKDPDNPRLAERLPWVVAFLFGLLHGFGFAGALNEIGLPKGEVPVALLTFNLGVEAGQLAIVAIAVAMLELLRRTNAANLDGAIRFASYAIGIVASVWFVERLLV